MRKPERREDDGTDGLRRLLSRHGIPEHSICGEQFHSYLGLLRKWNRKVNLTASTSWPSLEPFFVEAIAASRLYPHESADHLDIGSGAGFPALLMHILIPKMKLVLIESRVKRAAFLAAAAKELGLESTQVIDKRLEECAYLFEAAQPWQCISWKAIKLSDRALSLITRNCSGLTRFWMFHGREPAVENAESLERYLSLCARLILVEARQWHLSVFSPKRAEVSRETFDAQGAPIYFWGRMRM